MSGDARSILMNGQETAGPTGIDAIMASKVLLPLGRHTPHMRARTRVGASASACARAAPLGAPGGARKEAGSTGQRARVRGYW